MPSFDEVFGGIGEGAGDVARAGVADIGNTYVEQFLKGRSAPMTAPTGEMEFSSDPQEAQPQSYGAALRQHSDMEQADVRAKHEAAQATEAAAQETPHEPEI